MRKLVGFWGPLCISIQEVQGFPTWHGISVAFCTVLPDDFVYFLSIFLKKFLVRFLGQKEEARPLSGASEWVSIRGARGYPTWHGISIAICTVLPDGFAYFLNISLKKRLVKFLAPNKEAWPLWGGLRARPGCISMQGVQGFSTGHGLPVVFCTVLPDGFKY